jgi:cytochrome bd-type quinol oxidase subunit 2
VADDAQSSTRQQLMAASGGYAILVVAAVAVALGAAPVWTTLVSITTGASSAAILLGFVSTAALAIGYLFVAFRLHAYVDRAFFHAAGSAHRKIVSRLEVEVGQILGGTAKPSNDGLTNLFYEFVDRPDGTWPALKGQAADKWTPYQVAMDMIALSLFGVVGVALSFLTRNRIDLYNLAPLAALLLVLLLAYAISQFSIRPYLFRDVAEPQLTKMTRDCRPEFERLVKARFGAAPP